MGELIALFWQKTADLTVGAYYTQSELVGMGYLIAKTKNFTFPALDNIKVSKEEWEGRYAIIWPLERFGEDTWLAEAFFGEDDPGYQIIRKINIKGNVPSQEIKIKPLDKFGKKVVGTGEMSWADIQPGGEDYEWAKAIADEVKEIEAQTGGKLKFIEMEPFDKYQGPYASVKIEGMPSKVWQLYDETSPVSLFFIEFGMGFSSNREGLVGDVYLLAAAINNTGTAQEVAKKNRELAGDGKLADISFDWGFRIKPLEQFGQLDFFKGDRVKVMRSMYLNPSVLGKEGVITKVRDNTVDVRFKNISQRISDNKWVDSILVFAKEDLEKVVVVKVPEIKPLTRFGKLSNRTAVYSWSFGPEFYDILRKAIEKKITTDTTFHYNLLKEFGFSRGNRLFSPPDYPPIDILVDIAMEKAEEISTVTDLKSPVEVWLDKEGWLTVEVPDKWEEEKGPMIKPLEVFGQRNTIEIGDIITDRNGIKGKVTKIKHNDMDDQDYVYAVWDDSPGEELYILSDRIKDIYTGNDMPLNIKPLEVFG